MELGLAIKRLQRWVEAFPGADVTIGHHDRIISRKAFTGGIPKAWIKSFNEVLNASRLGTSLTRDCLRWRSERSDGEGGNGKNQLSEQICKAPYIGHLHTQIATPSGHATGQEILKCSALR
jgi:hypothetical protein